MKRAGELSLWGRKERQVESGSGTPTIVPCWQVFDPLDQVGTL